MPTDTPSPHRFLAPRATATQQQRQKPPSGLRNAVSVQTPQSVIATLQTPNTQLKKVTPARRFVIPPPRDAPSVETPVRAKEKEREVGRDVPSHETSPPKPRRKFERVESIQDSSQSSAVENKNEDDGEDVLQSIEQGSPSISNAQATANDDAEDFFSLSTNHHKRRRLSSPSSPSSRPATTPQTPHPTSNSTSHRFKVPPSRTPGPFTSTSHNPASLPLSKAHPTPTPHRPQFILPPHPTSSPKPSKPLPEIFSPSRKHGKYIPDGLASIMTGWIIETANTGFAAQERSGTGGVVWGRERDDGVKLKVRISHLCTGSADPSHAQDHVDEVECVAGAVVYVAGQLENHGNTGRPASLVDNEHSQVRILLAGQGDVRGSGRVPIKKGTLVGIRAPWWDIDVGAHIWTIGVDWVVL
ncbi:hypothetical protein J1614_003292 [Plenodomus biglobosus]|nr:hypothetical protein J1614_003292 [Plenodomus biglobosus]